MGHTSLCSNSGGGMGGVWVLGCMLKLEISIQAFVLFKNHTLSLILVLMDCEADG